MITDSIARRLIATALLGAGTAAAPAGKIVVEFTATVSTVDTGEYPGVTPGDTITGVYTATGLDPSADTDPAPDTGRWLVDATIDLTIGASTHITLARTGTVIVRDDFLALNDLVQFNIDEGPGVPNRRTFSITFLDTTQSLISGDAPPTPEVVNLFTDGFIPDEFRILNVAGTPTYLNGKKTSHHASCACGPDLDGNGVLNLDDIAAFATGFIAGDRVADLNCDYELNLDDIAAFADSFIAGCP
ncbi:MAG: GC-type dockerin domain-anchored protein [Phycisphaerales bacterium]